MPEQDKECQCFSIMENDSTRHFRGCPKREEYPTHEAETIISPSVVYPEKLLRLLVKSILTHAAAYDGWSLQGFGMFRLYLSKEMRLHVWDDRFQTMGVSTIHSHPWHFRSTVISGKMTDRLFEVAEAARSPFDSRSPLEPTHMKQKIVCGPGGGAVGVADHVRLSVLQEVTIEAGHSYGLAAEAFHESIPEPGTVTIIERQFREDTEHAYVCFPIGTHWVSAEPRKATMREVEAMAERALARLG